MIKGNKITILVLLLAIYIPKLQAQVTIGLDEPSLKGGLLQLKETANVSTDKANSTKGLILSRVALKDTKTIISVISGVDDSNIAEHTGLVVFNVTNNFLSNVESGVCPGIYVWHGSEWVRMQDDCCPLPIIESQPVAETFTREANGTIEPLTISALGLNLTYQWQVAPLSATPTFTDISGAISDTYTPPTSDYGFTIYRCVVNSNCGSTISNTTNVVVGCGALINAGQWQTFMCQNLGADMNADPFVPAKELNGNYYQWGRPTPVATVDTDPGAIPGWSNTYAADGSWSDATKTANDPCPSGWRVPSQTIWNAVVTSSTLNPQTFIGTSWVAGATNFSNGRKFGKFLYLPAAGTRNMNDGTLNNRGVSGTYWGSTLGTSTSGYSINYLSTSTFINRVSNYKSYGFSVRCIKE